MPAPIALPLPEAVRAFIALPVESRVQESLSAAQREWARRLPPRTVRWTPAEQIHLTLKFLGEIPSRELPALETALEEALSGATSMHLVASGFGCFPHERDPKVLWVGLKGDLPPLLALQGRIDEAMSAWVPREERPFHAHLTVGRIKFIPAPARRALQDWLTSRHDEMHLSWTTDRVDLMRSELGSDGARHTVLRAWPLRPDSPE